MSLFAFKIRLFCLLLSPERLLKNVCKSVRDPRKKQLRLTTEVQCSICNENLNLLSSLGLYLPANTFDLYVTRFSANIRSCSHVLSMPENLGGDKLDGFQQRYLGRILRINW